MTSYLFKLFFCQWMGYLYMPNKSTLACLINNGKGTQALLADDLRHIVTWMDNNLKLVVPVPSGYAPPGSYGSTWMNDTMGKDRADLITSYAFSPSLFIMWLFRVPVKFQSSF